MQRILFVCHGNICRSPMAEFVMKDLVQNSSNRTSIYVESAATSTEELGNPVHPGTRRILRDHGIDCSAKTARQMKKDDYGRFDYLIGMDDANIRRMEVIAGGDRDCKISKLLSFAGSDRNIADPWYTHDFEATYQDVLEGCRALYRYLVELS